PELDLAAVAPDGLSADGGRDGERRSSLEGRRADDALGEPQAEGLAVHLEPTARIERGPGEVDGVVRPQGRARGSGGERRAIGPALVGRRKDEWPAGARFEADRRRLAPPATSRDDDERDEGGERERRAHLHDHASWGAGGSRRRRPPAMAMQTSTLRS